MERGEREIRILPHKRLMCLRKTNKPYRILQGYNEPPYGKQVDLTQPTSRRVKGGL
jgi:hypothetical protein